MPKKIVVIIALAIALILFVSCSKSQFSDIPSAYERQTDIKNTKDDINSKGRTVELKHEMVEELNEFIAFKTKEDKVRERNEAFVLEGDGKIGILLLHGFSASPHEVKELAQYLHDNLNATVYVPLIACHGIDYRKFGDCSYEEWVSSTEEAYDDLSYAADDIYVGGISLGASLAIDIAKKHDVKGVIIIGAPVQFMDSAITYACIGKYFINSVPNYKLSKEERRYYYYDRSIAAICSLTKYVNKVNEDLYLVTDPIMILQAENDVTVNPASAIEIYSMVGSEDKQLDLFESDSHIIINTKDKGKIFSDIQGFISGHENG